MGWKEPYTDCRCQNIWNASHLLSNRIVEFLLSTHQLDRMVSDYDEVKREVFLGVSKLDFLVGNTYLEVKTPLTTVDVKYGDKVKTKKVTPFSSTDRMVKHVRELAGSLKDHERAILLTVYQYEPTEIKPHLHSTNFEEVLLCTVRREQSKDRTILSCFSVVKLVCMGLVLRAQRL